MIFHNVALCDLPHGFIANIKYQICKRINKSDLIKYTSIWKYFTPSAVNYYYFLLTNEPRILVVDIGFVLGNNQMLKESVPRLIYNVYVTLKDIYCIIINMRIIKHNLS